MISLKQANPEWPNSYSQKYGWLPGVGENRELLSNGNGVSAWENEKSSGGGWWWQLQINANRLNCTLKKMVKMVNQHYAYFTKIKSEKKVKVLNFMFHIFYHNEKSPRTHTDTHTQGLRFNKISKLSYCDQQSGEWHFLAVNMQFEKYNDYWYSLVPPPWLIIRHYKFSPTFPFTPSKNIPTQQKGLWEREYLSSIWSNFYLVSYAS